MSTSDSYDSTYSRYIGRVGALAAALGIGVMVVASPGIAGAAPSSSSSTSTGASSDSAAASNVTTGAGATSTSSTSASTDGGAGTGETSTGTTKAAGTASSSTSAAEPDESTEDTNGVAVEGTTATAIEVIDGEVVEGTDGGDEFEDADGGEGQGESGESTDSEDVAEPAEVSTPPVGSTPGQNVSTSGGSDSETAAADNVETSSSDSSATSVDSVSVVRPDTGSSTETTQSDATSTVTVEAASDTATSESATTAVAAADSAPIEPVVRVTGPVMGVVAFFNEIVTSLLNPFLAPTPDTPDPFTPIAWAALGWVRRNLFNQEPTINFDPTTSTQTGQTVTGTIDATDAEGDSLTYTITQAPEHGTVTIDQATGEFTYTPDNINYATTQTDSFTVSVTDHRLNLLSLFSPRGDMKTIGVTVLNPTVDRIVLDLLTGYTPLHSSYAGAPPPLQASRAGNVSGTAEVVETQQAWCSSGSRCFSPADDVLTIRTVTYTDFADEAGLVLNGTETTATNADLTFIHYLADISVTDEYGADRGFVQADARVTNRATLTGYIVSSVDGELHGFPLNPESANVAVDFGAEQGALLHTERYNQFHVSTTFAGQRPEDVEFLNEIGLHATLYRAWLNSPNQTEPTCTGSASSCELSPSMKAYLADLGNVSDAQIANFRLGEWVGMDPHEAQAEMEGILLAVKREQPEIVYIEAWNEPDQPPGGVDGGVTPAQAYAGYQALYRAVNSVNATLAEGNPDYVPLKVGGPALFYFNKPYLEAFLDAYVADTDPNKHLDFISYHGYLNILPDGSRQFFKENPSWVMNYRDEMDAILEARGLPVDTPVFVTETGIYPGPLCDNCDSTDYAHQAAGMAALHYWFSQQHDTYLFNWVSRRQGLKDQFVTQNAVGPQLDLTNPRNPTILWEPLDPLPTNALTPYGNMLLMQSMMEDIQVSAVSNQLNNGLGVYTLAAKDPVLPEASVMVWNYPGCSGTPGTTSCGATAYDTTIGMSQLPNGLDDGPVTLTVYRVDQHTSNYWENPLNTDLSKAQLEQVDQRTVLPVDGSISYQANLLPNSVYLVLLRKDTAGQSV